MLMGRDREVQGQEVAEELWGSESGIQGSEGAMQVQKCVLVLDAGNCTCSHWWSRHTSRLGGPSGKL